MTGNMIAAVRAAILAASLAVPTAVTADDIYEEKSLGLPDAPVTLIEYASFTCPHCATFHNLHFKDLKREYIDSGKVRFTLREVYFDRPGLWAGMVARCGPTDTHYFAVVDLLFERQAIWASQGTALDIVTELAQIGSAVGLSADQINTCFTDANFAENLMETSGQQMSDDGITSTPSFVIDGTRYSNMGYDEFTDILDLAVSESGYQPISSTEPTGANDSTEALQSSSTQSESGTGDSGDTSPGKN